MIRRVRCAFFSVPLWLWVILVPTIALSLSAAGPGELPGDVAVARAVQSVRAPGIEHIAQFGYWAGSLAVIAALGLTLAFALLVAGKYGESCLMFGAVLCRSLSPILKQLFASPRPDAGLVRVTEHASGFGFPSSHVFGAIILYGSVILIARTVTPVVVRRFTLALAGFAIVATSFSRVYSGAHWPSDVVGGYFWGFTILVVLNHVYQTVRTRLAHPSRVQVAKAPR